MFENFRHMLKISSWCSKKILIIIFGDHCHGVNLKAYTNTLLYFDIHAWKLLQINIVYLWKFSFDFSTKAWPLLYPLHLNTKVASDNGDISDVFLEWEYIAMQKNRCSNENNCSLRDHLVHFGYPGNWNTYEHWIKKMAFSIYLK